MAGTENMPNTEYGKRSYWHARFEAEREYEWLCDYDVLRDTLADLVKNTDRIVHLGCGTSTLSQQMYEDGFTDITNVDYAASLVERGMLESPHMSWKCSDIRDMHAVMGDGTADVVVEKATLDTLLAAAVDPWNVSDAPRDHVRRTLHEIWRILSPTGTFMSIAFGQPHFRVPLLVDLDWSIDVHTIGTDFHYYVYVMRKGVPRDMASIAK